MSEQLYTFYILHGDDDVSMDEQIQRFRDSMRDTPNGELNTDEFDGQETSVGAVLNAVGSFPFLADKRLVIVKNLITWNSRKGAGKSGKKALEELAEGLPNLPDYARLVLIERQVLDDKNPVVQTAKRRKKGFLKKFEVPKNTTNWIRSRAQNHYQVDIEPQAIQALVEVTGSDLRSVDNELCKLVAYVDGERPITVEDVAQLTPYVPEANIFDMVDFLANGKGQDALLLAHQIQKQKPREGVFGLYAMIIRQFRLLLLVREHLSTGGSSNPSDIAKAVGIAPFVANRLSVQSRSFTVTQLEDILRLLLNYDFQMKTGKINPEFALDIVITRLAG